MNAIYRRIAFCALLGLFLPTIIRAQEAIPLPLKDALSAHSFAVLVPARFSPDGKKFAYTVQNKQRARSNSQKESMRTGVPSWGIGTDIYVLDVASGGSKSITGGMADNWLPAWSPEGRFLAFLSDRGDGVHARLWLWDAVSDQLRKLSDVTIRIFPGGGDIVWTSDSKHIVITASPERSLADADEREKSLPNAEQPSMSRQSDSTVILYISNAGLSRKRSAPTSDPWNLDRYLRDLILLDVSDGSYRPLVRGRRIDSYRLSPDGSHIAYTTYKHFEKPGSQQILFDLDSVAVATGEDRVLASDIRLNFEGGFRWSPDGSRIAFRKGGMEERAFDYFVVRADGGELRNISAFPALDARPAYALPAIPLWDPKGTNIYFVHDGALWRAAPLGSAAEKVAAIPGRRIVRLIHRSGNLLWTPSDQQTIVVTHDDAGKQDGFYEIDLNRGTSFKLMEKGQCYTCANVEEWQFADVTQNGDIAFYAEDAEHSTDLWMADSSFQRVRRLTTLNPQFDKVSLGVARLIEWQTSDGERLRGALLLPSQYETRKRYPLIVWVYGGAFLSDNVDRFGLGLDGLFNMQLLATRGYAVLMPDAPQHQGTPMSDLAKTVMPGVDKVIDMGIADPERLGVMGHSYGSYSTLALIVQSTRFKAAMAADGMANLISAYGQMDSEGGAFETSVMEGGSGLMGGTPWQFRESYIDNSPFFYLDRTDTPLLIVHGSEDRTVASFLGDELFVALRRLGKTVQYAKYQGEGHVPGNWSYANQLDLSRRMITWFDDYLKKPAEHAPSVPQEPN